MKPSSPCSGLRAGAPLLGLLILGFGSSLAVAQPGPGPGGFGADPRADSRTYTFEETGEELPYCVFASSKISADEPAPLIISLHGLGAPPSIMCNATAIDLAEEGGYILAAPMGYSVSGWYGSPVIEMRRPGAPAPADALPAETLQEYSEKDVLNVLAMMRDEFNVDEDRIYLTGHSMGGAGTLHLGGKHAEIWAAIAPVAPAAFMLTDRRAEIIQRMDDADVAVMMVHGAADEVVPVDIARTWVATMEEVGIDHEYVELPDVTHGPVITESQSHIYEFFDAHSK